jgi:hypothetical protein
MRILRLLCGVTLAVGVLLAVAASPARAHTSLTGSTPAAGAETGALDHVTLRFDGPVDVESLHVWLEMGDDVQPLTAFAGAAATEADVPLRPIGAGEYRLGWHLVAADGDASGGAVPFSIAAAAAASDRATGDPLAIVALLATSAALVVALARRSSVLLVAPAAALGVAGCVAVALLGQLLPVPLIAVWVAGLAGLFAVVHPGLRRTRPKELLAR